MLKSYFVKIVSSILIISGLSAVSFFGYEQYKIYDFQKRYKEAPIGSVIQTGNMKLPRSNHSCIRLKNGKVLIIGGNKGIEIFDPKTGQYSIVSNKTENINGSLQNSILLSDGNVFIAGFYIFDSSQNKIIKIKNADKFLSKDNLSMSSMNAIYPIEISKDKVLVIGDDVPSYNNEEKVIMYDINNNSYNEYKINIPYSYKKLLGGGNTYIKEDDSILFILDGASKILKWNILTNKVESTKEYSLKWQQVFPLDQGNLLLNNGYVDNKTAILDLYTNSLYSLPALNRHIYGTFPISKFEFFIFTSNEKSDSSNKKLEIYRLNLPGKKLSKIDLTCKDNYFYNFYYTYNPQMFAQLSTHAFLYAGGQRQIPESTKVNISRIIKLGE